MATMQSQPPTDPAARSDVQEAISLPLYLSGLAVSLVGLFAVNSELSDPSFATTTAILTVIGFVFSFFCRWARVRVRVLEILGVCFIAYFGYRFLTNSFSLEAFLPSDVQQGDLIMAVVLVWLTVVRSWVLTTDESIVFSSVVSIAMIGLVGAYNVNTELLVYFGLYVISATFLLLHQNYLVYRSWSARAADSKTDDLVLRVQIGLSLASAIAVVVIGAVFIIPFHAVTSHLSLGNALRNLVAVEQKTAGDQNGTQDTGNQVELSDDQTLKVGTGEGFNASDTVLARAYPSDHQEHYWRGRTYDSYQGNSWASTIGDQRLPLKPGRGDPMYPGNDVFSPLPHQQIGAAPANSAAMNHPKGRPTVATRVDIVGGRTGMLYLPYDTLRILIPHGKVAKIGQAEDVNFDLPTEFGDGFTYTALSLAPDVTPADLRKAPPVSSDCPVQIRRYYIDQVGEQIVGPDDRARLDRTVHEIVAAIPARRRSDYEIAEAIRTYVSQRAVYSLAVSPVPEDQDAVTYFLFTSRRGYCDLFASAMAVLCRHAGLPARVATGFAPGIRNTQGGFDLRGMDKHAWVEVWFPKSGWVEFDPTLGSKADASVSPGNAGAELFRRLFASLTRFLNIEGPFPYVLFVLVVLGLAYLVKVELVDRIVNRRQQDARATGHRSLPAAMKVSRAAGIAWSRGVARHRYARMEYLLMRAGAPRHPAVTPLEFERWIETRVVELESLTSDVADAVVAAVSVLTEDMMLAAYAPVDLSGPASLEREESGAGAKALKTLETQASLLKRAIKQQERLAEKSNTPV